jgi:hypothetical protein
MAEGAFGFGLGSAISIFVIASVCGGLYGCPQYGVYQQRMAGEAELAQAEYSKQVQVRDAEGRLAAAEKLAQVEVARAGGVAKANQIIGDSLKGNDAYLRYLWITDVTGAKAPTVIYVPTEANIPILEAARTPRIPN